LQGKSLARVALGLEARHEALRFGDALDLDRDRVDRTAELCDLFLQLGDGARLGLSMRCTER
jgi:hypothetical protein